MPLFATVNSSDHTTTFLANPDLIVSRTLDSQQRVHFSEELIDSVGSRF